MIAAVEKALVGSLILEPDLIPATLAEVDSVDFDDATSREVFETLVRMHRAGDGIDLVTVAYGSNLAASVVAKLVDEANPDYAARWTQLVREASVARRAKEINLGRDISEAKIGEVGFTLEKTSGRLLKMADSLVTTKEKSLGELAAEITSEAKSSIESGVSTGSLVGISTGFPRLNRVTAGFERGELIVVAARTSIGKTSFALNLATNMSLFGGHSVAFYSIEMTAKALAMRIQSSLADVDSQAIAQGRLNVYEMGRLENAREQMAKMPMSVAVPTRGRGWTVERLEGHARRVPDLKAVFVDYVQLMESGNRSENRVQEVSAITRGLKAVATRLEVPVIALSQLRRTSDENAEPTLSDLRESGSIEQDSDMVLFLHRNRETEAGRRGETDLIVAKNRRGPLAKMAMRFNFSTTTFTDRMPAVVEP